MLTFISCAKTMSGATAKVRVPNLTVPRFQQEAVQNALDMAQYSSEELARLLRVNEKIAAENYLRYRDFCSQDTKVIPALLAYTGVVFKHICPADFSAADFDYAQQHLRITSFLYGLLRPLDGIKLYRLEGDVRLPERGGISLFNYWKSLLTDWFIETIKEKGGVLLNLASNEMQDLFDWTRVSREVRVITPDFQVWKGGKLASIVVYVKMCRGEMARMAIKNRISNPEDLKSFSWEGFRFDESRSEDDHYQFTLG